MTQPPLSADATSRRDPAARFRVGLGALFLLGLALRAGFAWEVRDLPTFAHPVMDAATHLRLGHQLAAGAWIPRQPFYQAPLYPYLLALLERLTGAPAAAARVLQVLLGAATPVLLALGVAPAFGRRAALATALGVAVYGPHVVFAPLVLKETLALALLAAALVLLARLLPDGAPRPAAAATLGLGALLGVAAQLRENLLVLWPLAALAVAWPAHRRPGLAARRAAGVAAGGCLALLPVSLLNARAGGPWFLTSSQSGMNFYIGNVLSRSGTYAALSNGPQDPEAQREDARRVAMRLRAERGGASAVAPDDPEVSRIFWRASRAAIAADPGRWLGLLARKLRLFWSDYEVPDAEGWIVLRQLSAVLALAPLTLGSLLGLAVLGVLPAWRRDRRLTLALLGGAAAVCASVVAFFVFGRYRLPVVLFLAPFAGLGAVTWLDALRARRFATAAASAALAGLVAALAFTPPLGAADRAAHEGALWFNLGQAGDRAAGEALEQAERSDAATRPALLDRAARDAAGAVGFLDRALALDPGFFIARVERGVALQRCARARLLAGDAASAAELYAAAATALDGAAAATPEWADAGLRASLDAVRDATRRGLAAARAALAGPRP